MDLQKMDGALNISDDIIIHGKDTAEHDKRLEATLQCLRQKSLTLYADKCEFNQTHIGFYGYVISPDLDKVHAIKSASPPVNALQVRSFLGMVQYCARFIPKLATLSKPLQDL